MIDLMISQLTDLFRIGLIIGLVVTMNRTSAVTGKYLPLALGVIFVAVILPTTMPSASVSLREAITVGVLSNVIILIHVLAISRLISRFRP